MTEQVVEVMEKSDEPFMTLGEITKEVDVTKKTVHNRLSELVEDGQVSRKKVGAKAVVWWLPERYQGRYSPESVAE
jgi:predicted transcriptional regulator